MLAKPRLDNFPCEKRSSFFIKIYLFRRKVSNSKKVVMARIVMLQQPVFGQFINGLTFNATTSKEQAGSWPKNLNTKSNPPNALFIFIQDDDEAANEKTQ
jgi:hypothetical protein